MQIDQVLTIFFWIRQLQGQQPGLQAPFGKRKEIQLTLYLLKTNNCDKIFQSLKTPNIILIGNVYLFLTLSVKGIT